jgi:hypothetical protein
MIENERVRRDFRRILEEQPHISDSRIISTWFFEAPNIFDPKPTTRLKPDIVIVLIYIALTVAVCAAFNLR